jgi:hypothetical protein
MVETREYLAQSPDKSVQHYVQPLAGATGIDLADESALPLSGELLNGSIDEVTKAGKELAHRLPERHVRRVLQELRHMSFYNRKIAVLVCAQGRPRFSEATQIEVTAVIEDLERNDQDMDIRDFGRQVLRAPRSQWTW